MNNFDNIEEIKKIDPQNTLGSTEQLAKQCLVAWQEIQNLEIGEYDISNIKNIVMCGMGASMYGALVLKSLIGKKLPFPFEIISDYNLPSYVDTNSLIVLTSYSGTTEEVLSCASQAKEKNAKMICVTKGGSLAEFANENNLPSYIFDAALNPAGVPRLANGYTILGLFGLLKKLNLLDLNHKEIEEALLNLQNTNDSLKKQALEDYKKCAGKIPVITAAEHLHGNAHILRNQFNETSKTFSSYFMVPDLNHHLMEGLQFPSDSPLVFLIMESKNYSSKIQKRMDLTKDVILQNKHDIISFQTKGLSVYEDFLQALIYGSYMSLFLGLHYDQNPAINPWVDYFKNKLA